MKHVFKYAIGIGFLVFGLWQGCLSASVLVARLSSLSDVTVYLASALPFVKYHGWIAYIGEIIQMTLLLLCSVLCIFIALKSSGWKRLLCCGLLGIFPYLLGIAFAAYVHNLTLDLALSLLRFAIIPVLITWLSFHSRRHQDVNQYFTVPYFIRMVFLLFR